MKINPELDNCITELPAERGRRRQQRRINRFGSVSRHARMEQQIGRVGNQDRQGDRMPFERRSREKFLTMVFVEV